MDRFLSFLSSQRRVSLQRAFLSGIAFSVLCLGIGCGDFTLFGDDDDDNGNTAPEAVASADPSDPKACGTETVSLNGTESSDPDGDSLTYQWEITDRPAGSTAALQNATASQASLQPDEAGTYTVQLTVEDPGGQSDTASVTVTAGSGPVADAGADQQVSLGASVTLDGGDSANPEEGCSADGLEFSWSLQDPDGGQIDLGTDVQETFTANLEGTYVATLTVENETGSDFDEVQIDVGGPLDALVGGPYLFTVDEVEDGILPGGILEDLEGTTLDETVDIPSTDEVPAESTISLDYQVPLIVDAQIEIVVEIDREDPLDDFYTLTGKSVSGTVSGLGFSCELQNADAGGVLTPVTTTTVTVSLTVSNLEVNSECASLINEEGTLQITLSGVLQQ